jgi:transposase-like protein
MVRRVVDDGLSKAAAARQFNTTPKTVAKWVVRDADARAIVSARERPRAWVHSWHGARPNRSDYRNKTGRLLERHTETDHGTALDPVA